LKGKSGFLSPGFYIIWSVLSIGLWSLLGWKIRKMGLDTDKNGTMDYETGKKWIWKNTVWCSLYTVFFGLTVASTVPWLWLMSIDAHWYSTMYSWYTFASTFVSGLSLMAIFIIYLRGKGELEYVTDEHLHDAGKFMFAFSIFWTYLWFSQYMLIWYSNQPEETRYFVDRIGTQTQSGHYHGMFFLNLVLNFVGPLLILMKRNSKRNYATLTFMAVFILFGHWLDFYQMVFPGPVGNHLELGILDFGVALGFVGLIMYVVGQQLSKYPLYAKNHPFFKETIIHHT